MNISKTKILSWPDPDVILLVDELHLTCPTWMGYIQHQQNLQLGPSALETHSDWLLKYPLIHPAPQQLKVNGPATL